MYMWGANTKGFIIITTCLGFWVGTLGHRNQGEMVFVACASHLCTCQQFLHTCRVVEHKLSELLQNGQCCQVTLVPAFNDLTLAQSEFDWVTPSVAAIEHRAIR